MGEGANAECGESKEKENHLSQAKIDIVKWYELVYWRGLGEPQGLRLSSVPGFGTSGFETNIPEIVKRQLGAGVTRVSGTARETRKVLVSRVAIVGIRILGRRSGISGWISCHWNLTGSVCVYRHEGLRTE
jgi:hypothetical protein